MSHRSRNRKGCRAMTDAEYTKHERNKRNAQAMDRERKEFEKGGNDGGVQ